MKHNLKIIREIIKNPNEALLAAAGRNRVCYLAVKFAVFVRVVVSEYIRNHCTSRASGIAFVLLITMIPLIATAALLLASIAEITPHHVERAVKAVLPFSPPTVVGYILEFFQNARGLNGIGIAVLIVTAMGLFNIIEQSLNAIWKVGRVRPFFNRLRTFTMVIVYSPILFFVSFQLRHSGIFGLLPRDFFLMRLPPIIFTALAFTVMFWSIPSTRVHASSAAIGGLISCALFELERWGFGYYVNLSIQTQTIYGTFGLIVFFLISLYFSALLLLIGAQVVYVHQNFRPLLRAAQRWDRRVGDYRSYIIMRIIIDCVSSFRKKEAPPTIERFCETYELTDQQASGILNWLIHEKFIHQIQGSGKGFVPARDFSVDTVSSVFSAIEDQYRRIPIHPQDGTKEYLTKFIGDYGGRKFEGDITFYELIDTVDG
ncbi:MAG: YihY/virulence factor BrkB family protein [Chitinispirillales bacterium]|jgi:membrane protein|nr:YihY/virulence factor BrkB family protein [Chitinispirillales bacterium]